MSLLWATRGRTWGFRFLRTAGLTDPLPAYEDAFSGIGDEPEICRRSGSQVALRLRDPHGRKDQSGRMIVHDFVLRGSAAVGVDSVRGGLETVWPLVEEEYAQVYDSSAPPPPRDEVRN